MGGAGKASGLRYSRRSRERAGCWERSRSTARPSKSTAPLVVEKGAYGEAIGRSRDGRKTKIHALTDAEARPRVILLNPGNAHDVVMAPALIQAAGPMLRLIADKAYDTNPLRNQLAGKGIEAIIPSIR